MRALLACRKIPSGFSASFLQSAARIICSLLANKFYTCSLRCVFAHVQEVNCPKGARETTLGCAAVENDLTLFSAYAENSAKLF